MSHLPLSFEEGEFGLFISLSSSRQPMLSAMQPFKCNLSSLLGLQRGCLTCSDHPHTVYSSLFSQCKGVVYWRCAKCFCWTGTKDAKSKHNSCASFNKAFRRPLKNHRIAFKGSTLATMASAVEARRRC